eukprot:364618-Chlamydomonas_euryale.AAC.5
MARSLLKFPHVRGLGGWELHGQGGLGGWELHGQGGAGWGTRGRKGTGRSARQACASEGLGPQGFAGTWKGKGICRGVEGQGGAHRGAADAATYFVAGRSRLPCESAQRTALF